MIKCLGFGGLGDCFIVILKLLEYKNPFIYTHIDTSVNRLKLSVELLDFFNIKHQCFIVKDIRQWWMSNSKNYDKHFNVFAKGYIDIPRRSYHWQPCIDEGYINAFSNRVPAKTKHVAVQVNSGGNRNYKHKPVVEYTTSNFDKDKILWFGTDKDFKSEYGTNYCGKLNFTEALKHIAQCESFIGFHSVLLYWALYNRIQCYLFTDHQGREDLRIHDEWKQYLKYDIGVG